MDEEMSKIKSFLKDFCNNDQSPTEEATRIGNYTLDPEDVHGHVIDWVLTHLNNRKCPYSLAVSIAKEIALQVSASHTQDKVENFEKTFSSSDLYSEAINKISTICNELSNQVNMENISLTKYPTSAFAIRNKRRKMEDRHVILHDLNAVLDLKDAPYHSYYAVFDGHSGIDAACYASAQLHINISKHPDFLTDTPKAIIEGYQITDKNFLNKCNKLNIKSGCTALSALIRNNTLFLSWLGDSQAVLVKGGVPIKITSPHKPDREDERLRIEQLGGHVSHMGTWRVNGLLAVTRAIGDPDQKPFISSEPELDIINLDGNEDFLILACDGLWDGISPEDASSALYRYLADSSSDDLVNPIAAKLVHQSKLQGSEDNITTIVVFLRDVKDIISNAEQFLSSSSMYYVQNHDFMSMNGNMNLPMDSNSDNSFSKPTVLELNAASSKKLKNAANVMSSAGFGSASYSYQFVENLDENSFQSLESSVVDSSQTAYVSQAAHSASCFAPEATALSELPTPPIDDMLASQQFDNFTSTDLYKELNSSAQEQHVESYKTELLETNNELLSDFLSNPIQNSENKSLESNSETVSNSVLSPDDAIGIATDVVSSTIESAVKCLAEESPDLVSVQSSTKLNPYAKPFVMKSFFNPEETNTMSNSFIGDNLNDATSTCEIVDTNLMDQPNTEITEAIICNQSITEDLNNDQISDSYEQKSIDQNLELHGSERSACSENISQKLDEPENKTVEHLNIEENIENINRDLLCDFQKTNITETCYNQIASEKSDIFSSEHTDANVLVQGQLSDMSLLGMDFEKMRLESLKSESDLNVKKDVVTSSEDKMSPSVENNLSLNQCSFENQTFISESVEVQYFEQTVTQFENSEKLISEENKTPDSSISNTSEIKSKVGDEHNIGNGNAENDANETYQTINAEVALATDVNVNQVVDKEAEKELISESLCQKSNESTTDTPNQNLDLSGVSGKLDSEITDTGIKSKFEEIEKSIAVAVIKNENSESSCCVEPISLINNMKDELISTGSEMPSDPSVEDSRTESVAVDLKSLPEGIPEAEGVTEDIDSDSEKDGGWSYMKGNIVAGSKPKTEEKTSKSNEIKSNIATKSKRDISKQSLDVKNKAKNTTIDKTKSSTPDKSKAVTQDKTKTIADKSKGVTAVDKTRTLASLDKNKRITAEKKIDAKSKVLKSSTSSTTKVASERASKIASTSSTVRKVTSETSGITTTATTTAPAKPTRPTTLLRTSAASVDKNTLSNKATPKSKTTSLLSENKPVKSNVSSVINKGQISSQIKSTNLTSRTTSARPASTVLGKTSTVVRTTVQKSSGVSEPKPKLPTSSASTLRRPLSAAAKKPDVKEVKDNVNKQILAKKTTTTSRIESNSTVTNKKVVSYNNKSASARIPATHKTEINKKEVPKTAFNKQSVKKADSKVPRDVGKNEEKIIQSVQAKADETKDNSNVQSDQKSLMEAAQVIEEKFILETNDKEIAKEVPQITNEEQIVENGSLTKTESPDEVIPVTECNPENLS